MELLEFDGPIGKSPAGLEMFRAISCGYMTFSKALGGVRGRTFRFFGTQFTLDCILHMLER